MPPRNLGKSDGNGRLQQFLFHRKLLGLQAARFAEAGYRYSETITDSRAILAMQSGWHNSRRLWLDCNRVFFYPLPSITDIADRISLN
jgi:hypothetical protein